MRGSLRRRGQIQEFDAGGEQEYWLSYSDLLAGLLMVFALMLLVALGHYQGRAKDVRDILESRQALIDEAAGQADPQDDGKKEAHRQVPPPKDPSQLIGVDLRLVIQLDTIRLPQNLEALFRELVGYEY